MLKVLLTRSNEENDLAASQLSRLGFDPCLAPMIFYENLSYDFTNIRRHIIITSKYAAKIVAANILPKELDLNNITCEAWVVGQESAAILRTNPCIKITGIAQDLKALNSIISMVPKEEAKDFFSSSLYLSGNIITHNLPGFIKRDIIYKVIYANKIPTDVISKIRNREIGYIMVFSKNSAKNLIRLFHEYKLLPHIYSSIVICISKEVASLFENISSKVLHSELPNFSNMIKILIHEKKIT